MWGIIVLIFIYILILFDVGVCKINGLQSCQLFLIIEEGVSKVVESLFIYKKNLASS